MSTTTRTRTLRLLAILATSLLTTPSSSAEPEPFRIDVVEADTGWPVPLVELRTTHDVRFVSDNRGIIAFDLPELMGTEVWFSVEGHGYGVRADGFGNRGVRLTPEPGGETTIEVTRSLPAKRLGRLTGAGIFGESQRFGLEPEWRETRVVGCDSVQVARHDGKLFWAWGDTDTPRYPLGLYHMTSATTDLRPLKSLEPPLRLRFDHFRDADGRVRSVAEMPGDGPTWVSGFASLPDEDGRARLVGAYVKVQGFLDVYETGLCVWNDDTQRFDRHRVLWSKTTEDPDSPPAPRGHATHWTVESGDRWLLFGNPFPRIKMRATFEAWEDPATWEHLEPQASVPTRDGAEAVVPHGGSIAWNAHRKRWVTVFTQRHGSPSSLGELWYAESEHPTGPWGDAVKVVTHANYSFYNPRLHPELTDDESPVLLFEGTFTRLFADHAEAVPRYDYNQILYRLDLDDPTLVVE